MEQDAESLLWSTYRTVGAGWPDFYALLREPLDAEAEALRLAINALYAHAGANRDHRDIRRRFYYQMLQEKVLPEARRVLLDDSARHAYDEQWHRHQSGSPGTISYEQFLAALPSASQPSQTAGPLDAQIAQELTARLEAQLAGQRAAQGKDDELSEDDMGTLPVSAPPEVAPSNPLSGAAMPQPPRPRPKREQQPEPDDANKTGEADEPDEAEETDETGASTPRQEPLPEPEPPLDLQVLAVKELPSEALARQTTDMGRLRVRGRQLLQAGAARAPLAAAPLEPDQPGSAAGASAAGASASGARGAQGAPGASLSRIVVGLSNEEMRAIGRRSQRRWARRSTIRLALGAAAVALLASGATWALLGRTQGVAGSAAEAHLQTAVEGAIYRAIARSQQARAQTSALAGRSGLATPASTRTSASPARAQGMDAVAANVPRMRLDTLLQNADFEGLPGCSDGDLKPWQVWPGTHGSGAGAAFAVGAGREQDARSGRWRLVFWKPTPYEASVFQIVKNLRPGLYQLNAWAKSSGGQDWAGIVIAGYGGPRLHVRAPASTRWTPLTVRGIRVTNGQCKIGFYTRSLKGRQWLAVDAVEFQRQG